MLESLITDAFEYEKLSVEEQQKRGILGRLVGIVADYKNPTRNGRLYTEELWDKTFENPIMKERIENRCCFGELGHPLDGRTETDMEKIAICMNGVPKKDKAGKLQAVFDILDTPNGRILKTLCDYGCNIGISSRGSGDTYTDIDGMEKVDPETYECECWDAVLIPAVKEARLSYVTESLGKKTLKQALAESVNKANENDRRVMQETIKNLNIGYTPEKVNSIDAGRDAAAVDNGVSILEDLQKTLKEKQELERRVIGLQEKLSVGYSKEANLQEELEKCKTQISKLIKESKKVNPLQQKVAQLQEQLATKEKECLSSKSEVSNLVEAKSKTAKVANSLQEKLEAKNSENVKLKKAYSELKNKFEASEKANIETISELKENISKLHTDSAIKNEEYSKKLGSSNALVEKYKKVAQAAVDKYVTAQATRIGVKPSEIKAKLSENYSFADIDRVCEDLQEYKLNLSKLPFSTLPNGKNVKVAVKESYEPIKPKVLNGADDEIDSQLISLAEMD